MTFKRNFLKTTMIFVATTTSIAHATTVRCSDALGTAKYDAQLSDSNRANHFDNISWTIDGKSLMQESSLEVSGRPDGTPGYSRPHPEVTSELMELATLHIGTTTQLIGGRFLKTTMVSTYTVSAKVLSIDTQKVVFEGYMLCVSEKSVK